MRPIKAALCVWLLCVNLSAAPATSGIQWEVRTGGNDLNSGGFNTGNATACVGGTDYSQSDTPHVTFDAATITATTSGASGTMTITGYTVATTDKCNILHIASGTNFTAGYYTINSVNVGANTWTLDANVSSGAGSAMVGRMGGGFATIQTAATNWQAQDAIWVKNDGTYTLTTTITPASASSTGPIQSLISGYHTTHGDSGLTTITSATNSVVLLTLSNAFRYARVSNFAFTHTAGTRGDCIKSTTNNSVMSFQTSTFDGCQIGIDITAQGDPALVENVEIKNSISHAISTAWGLDVENSNIHDNGGAGIRLFQQVGSQVVIEARNNVFRANSYCFSTGADNFSSLKIVNNSCVNSVNDGLLFSNNLGGSGTWQAMVRNNIFYGNGTGGTGYGINGTSGVPTPSVNDHNAYGANATGALNIWNAGTGDVTLTADPFVARTGGNFALNSTAGGGAALKGVGFPGALQSGGTGYLDVGALQSNGAATVCSSSCVQ